MNIFKKIFTTRRGRINRIRKSYINKSKVKPSLSNPSVINADIIVTSTGESLDVSELVKSIK